MMLAFQTMNTKRRRDDDSDSEDDRYLKVRVLRSSPQGLAISSREPPMSMLRKKREEKQCKDNWLCFDLYDGNIAIKQLTSSRDHDHGPFKQLCHGQRSTMRKPQTPTLLMSQTPRPLA